MSLSCELSPRYIPHLSTCTPRSPLLQLVTVNNPDKIIFVGEALAGNEAVDQLTGFNRSLRDFSGTSTARGIDGMILTK
jgi:signal recognition particle receptor subunit alpha